ncbi:MAG: hypothetical protein Q9214_002835, partial [Letrouitia sp. 1 TL-2023]
SPENDNVMEASSSATPSNPRYTSSAGPSPPPRNSMEDADSSSTRKRPRLDSGNHTMTADRSSATPSQLGSSTAPTTPPLDHPLQSSEHSDSFLSTIDRTPSKVTINVRDQSHHSPSLAPTSHDYNAAEYEHKGGLISPDEGVEPSKAKSPSPRIISVSSSPSRSPEIEVAEVEDINEEPGQTKWRPLVSSVLDAKAVQESLLERFPYLNQARDLPHTVVILASHFEKSKSSASTNFLTTCLAEADPMSNGDLFQELADWIEDYLSSTEPYPTQWYNMYIEESIFWQTLISIATNLCKRGHQPQILPLDVHGDPRDHQSFRDFLVAFGALSLRFLQVDCQTLKEFTPGSSTKPDLISEPYLSWLSNIVATNDFFFWKYLHNIYRFDPKRTVTAIIERFTCEPSGGLGYLTQYAKDLLDRSQNAPAVTANLWTALSIVNRMLAHYNLILNARNPTLTQQLLILHELPVESYRLFEEIDKTLQTFISKKASALSHEISQNLVTQLSEMILRILVSSEQMTTSFLKGSINLTEDLNSDEAPIVAEQAWKFQLLKKCLLEGRMEIRVQGVDTMQQELVKVYRDHIQHNPTGHQHQVVRFLCDFIISNRLVEYLVGVESHPQLISRCANIIGFLVINNKYTEADSDAIWKAVKMSQDSRVIDAILQMLPVIISLSDYNVLLYLVTKLNETPLDAFDNRMINYGTSLLTELQKKWGGLRENASLDLPPYYLCIRLIREAATGSSLPFAKRRNINAFASTQLLSLLAMGPSHGDKKRIYNECIEEIAENTKFATGSISALNAFLKHDNGTDIMALVHDFALADLIITNFVHTAESAPRNSPNLQVIDETLAVRLDLLQIIIMFAPDSISPERGRSLWDAMVGPKALSDLDRDSALAMLVTAIQGSMGRNAFIDRCINEYLPQLAPRYFTQNIMHFITHVAHYESCFPQSNTDEDNSNMVPTVIDILWRISLVAPANSIERKAISMLVALYLDTPKAQCTPKATITQMHEEVVERCIRQLTSAALKLKSSSDGTSSGEDEPMIIVMSDEEIDSQKLSFIRSLLILRELVHGIQSRAVYSPIPRVHPEIVRDVEVIKGDPVKIRYQPFSGGKDAGIKIIELGDLETIDALSKRLTALTSFSKFTVIAGGQKVHLVDCAESTIRDSKLHEKGLILIKKIIDDDAAPDLTPLRPLKPLEVGVMAHFQELYQLLSLEERLAADVFEFLVAFPPHDHVVGLLSSADTPVDVVLPPASPFKSFYSLYTLSSSLKTQLANGTSSSDFIRRGIQLMVESLMKDTGIGASLSTTGEIKATSSLIDCLLKYLKGKKKMLVRIVLADERFIAEHASSEVFDQISLDSKAFVNRLLSLITAAQNVNKNSLSENLISGPFAVILEVSLHSDKVWSAFKETGDPQSLLRRTLLQEPSQKIREGIAKAIESICTIPSQENPKTTDFAPYFWEFFTYLIPDSLGYSHNSEQFFTLSTLLFRQLDGAHRQNLDLSNYVREWSALLLRHQHHEFVGRDSLDWVIYGISGLIQLCIQFAKALEKPLKLEYADLLPASLSSADSRSDTLMEELFQTHLFPEISQAELDTPFQVRIPTLHSKTRAGLYTILLALSSDSKAYRKLLLMVRNLLRQGEGSQAWSWGIAQIVEDYTYDANWNFDRMCSIRSATGYPGLKNLSNTCYLNSLFTQLFMNVRFRDFVLNTNIADGRESQRILAETKTLFA